MVYILRPNSISEKLNWLIGDGFVWHEISKNQPCPQIFNIMFVRGFAKDSN